MKPLRVLSLFDEEQFKKIYDGKYELSSKGYIVSNVGKRKILKGKLTSSGYRMIVLTVNGKKLYPNLHRLIAQAFIPNPDNLPEVNHKDGNKDNNCVDNLEWVTTIQNQKHCRDNLNPRYTKINKDIANLIRLETGLSHRKIAEKYGLKKTQVGYILQGKRWA